MFFSWHIFVCEFMYYLFISPDGLRNDFLGIIFCNLTYFECVNIIGVVMCLIFFCTSNCHILLVFQFLMLRDGYFKLMNGLVLVIVDLLSKLMMLIFDCLIYILWIRWSVNIYIGIVSIARKCLACEYILPNDANLVYISRLLFAIK